ncbi:hypothetical protein Ptr902_12625 [Pyrenophora tritici-repentis]|nr:hypothetical protein Ptr902_12625 [Pyrenophora tritici-repentis]
MSGPGENRWRRQGQGNRNSGTNTPTKDNGRQQAMSSLTGNAWGAKQGKAGGAGPTATTAQAQPDNHVPVKDFNANEVKEFLKKSMSDGPCFWMTANPTAEYMESTASMNPNIARMASA